MKSVVRAFIFNPEGEILITRHTENAPWVLPGGHVESGEALHIAMERELREEFDISGRFFETDPDEVLHHRGKKLTHCPLPIASYLLEYKDATGRDKSRIEYLFLMETDEIIQKYDTNEIVAYRWIDPEDFLSLKPNIEAWDFTIEVLERILDVPEDA